MGTDILKSFSTLQNELDLAKTSLKGVDENIKRLIGRDPSDIPPRPGVKRGATNQVEERGRQRGLTNPTEDRNRLRGPRQRIAGHENDEPPIKKRSSGISVFKRLSDRPVPEDIASKQFQKQMISKVIVTPKEVPSRQEALDAQSKDERSKARNRRMFGALLGTLQKFQQEETKLKKREDKRAKLEKKIEEHEIKEKEEIKKERQELFFNRKKKQAEIKMIELKMIRMKEYSVWEERQKPRLNFIYTKSKPHIHFLPRKLNDANKALLETSKTDIQKIIEKKRQQVQDELEHIEDRMKRNFEPRKPKQDIADEAEHEPFEDVDTMLEELSSNKKEENGSSLMDLPETELEDHSEPLEESIPSNDVIQEVEVNLESIEIPKYTETTTNTVSSENRETFIPKEISTNEEINDQTTITRSVNGDVLCE